MITRNHSLGKAQIRNLTQISSDREDDWNLNALRHRTSYLILMQQRDNVP